MGLATGAIQCNLLAPVIVPSLEIAPGEDARRRSARSPLERTLLPDFSTWLLDLITELQPDIIVPVETKGARLLDAALMHASDASSINVPVLYTPALSFVDPEQLSDSRVLLLDDAARSGNTVRRHRERLARYGATKVDVAVCVSAGDAHPDGIQSFCSADDAVYREYLFQLAELVVARGLPPEIDHLGFRLSVSAPLVDFWADLVTTLAPYGELSLDGPLTAGAEMESMTLHFPALPGMPHYPVRGHARDQGVRKLRLFLDSAKGLIHVVPVAFAALNLPADSDPWQLSTDLCSTVVNSWTKDRRTIGDTLVAEAYTRDAEFLFRTLATTTEIDLMCGFARLLGREMSREVVAIASEPSLLSRLYGRPLGAVVNAHADQSVAGAFEEGKKTAATMPEVAHEPEILRLDASVVSATREVANYLKARFVARRKAVDFDPLSRVGLSTMELGRVVPPEGMDGLMLSRCIDYGLARTTLVPFTDVEPLESGEIRVRRKYRVAEASRADQDYEDVETMRREAGEELIALTAHVFVQRTELWPSRLVPYDIVACGVALLRAVVPGIPGFPDVVYSPAGPRLTLGEPANTKSVYSISSKHFRLKGDDIEPTECFMSAYADGQLRLDERNAGTVEIESYLKSIAGLLSTADDASGDLLAWATKAQPRMGLDVFEHHFRRATDELMEPLNVILRGDRVSEAAVAQTVKYADELIDAALATLSLIESDTLTKTRSAWPSPDRTESRLANLAMAPVRPPDLLEIGRLTCAGLRRAGEELKRLIEETQGMDSADDSICFEIVDAMLSVEYELTTTSPPPSTPSSHGIDPVLAAAKAIRRVVNLGRARAAALAAIYRGLPRQHRVRRPSGPRLATVVVADLSGSTRRSVRHEHGETVRWSNDGLNLVAQWARAFKGAEIGAREGDSIRVEFESADAALLCAAVVQRHTEALRATGREGVSWSCRIAIDAGQISDGDEDNVIGRCINLAHKLLDFQKDDSEVPGRVLITPKAAASLCAQIREHHLRPMGREFDLDPNFSASIDDEGARFEPLYATAAEVVNLLITTPAQS